MSSERWSRAWQLFEEALDRAVEEREAFLDRECDDPEMRRAVERWLSADSEATGFLEGGLSPAPPEWKLDLVGRRLGAYEVLREIGRGGMGTVYLARQKDETFDRRVALKVLSSAPFGDEARRRFQVERQILATLDHPAIARIYDGGATAEGVPYLVLEYVPGEEIDRYCATKDLPLHQRLDLMRQVCEAVSAAHRELIVHRDLKPSNLLVRDDGQPKLLDFGIAKLLAGAQAGSGDPDPTRSLSRPLTPRYASPEQLRGDRVTTATDVYSLGVLLYQLLCDELPFSGRGDLRDALQEIEAGPPPPSSRAADRPALARRLRGDLDSIVLRALRPEPELRYASADHLQADLHRYLRGLPVEARRGGRRYRAGKFLRRHRWPAVAAAALLVGLISTATVLAVGNQRLESERSKLQEVVGFFQGVFEQAGPYVSRGVDLSIQQAVDRSAAKLEDELESQPEVRAALAQTLGTVYLDLGDAETALRWSEEALRLHQITAGEGSVETARSLDQVGASLRELSRLDEAMAVSEEAIRGLGAAADLPEADWIRGLNNRVKLLCYRGEFEAADSPSREALGRARRDLAEDHNATLVALTQRAQVLSRTGDPGGAIALYKEAQAILEGLPEGVHPELPAVHNNLARLLSSQGEDAAAVAYLQASDEQFIQLYGEDFPERVKPLMALARFARLDGDLDRATALYGEAARVGRLNGSAPFVLRPVQPLAELLLEAGDCQAAERELRSSLGGLPDSARSSWRYAAAECLRGVSLSCLGRRAEAGPLLQRSVQALEAASRQPGKLCLDAFEDHFG